MNFNLKAIIGAFLLVSAIPAVANELPEGFIKIGCSKENRWKAGCVVDYCIMNNINLVPAVKSEVFEKLEKLASARDDDSQAEILNYPKFTRTSNGEAICHKEKMKELLKHIATVDPKRATKLAIILMNDEAANRAFFVVFGPNPAAIHNTTFFETMFE